LLTVVLVTVPNVDRVSPLCSVMPLDVFPVDTMYLVMTRIPLTLQRQHRWRAIARQSRTDGFSRTMAFHVAGLRRLGSAPAACLGGPV